MHVYKGIIIFILFSNLFFINLWCMRRRSVGVREGRGEGGGIAVGDHPPISPLPYVRRGLVSARALVSTSVSAALM